MTVAEKPSAIRSVNAAGMEILQNRYGAELDRVAVEAICERLSRSLQGATTTENQFSAFVICAYQMGAGYLAASAMFRQHVTGDIGFQNLLWVTPYMTRDGEYLKWRNEERSLYLA